MKMKGFYFLLTLRVTLVEPLYGKIGDKAVITQDSVANPITRITWKHGTDMAMEWFGGEIFAYRHFEDRGMLNISTGALTITGLTRDDSGIYTAEINREIASKTELLVISPVSKPTLIQSCEMTSCLLTCNGNTTGAEPVTYHWWSGDLNWTSTKEHKITMEKKEPWFSCTLNNPVSSSSSEKVPNPFIKISEGDQERMHYLLILLFLIPVLVIGGIIYFRCKGRRGKADFGTQEGKAVEGTEEEMTMLAYQETSPQDPTSAEAKDTCNGTVISIHSEVHETPDQHQETAASPDLSNETGVQETSTQDPTSTVAPETMISVHSEVHETPDQHQETAESPETEKPEVIPDYLQMDVVADPEDEAQS